MLSKIQSLVDAFEHESIPYCHWKSNQNIKQALRGDDDLDILLSPSCRERILPIISSLGFISLSSAADKITEDIRHFYGYDEKADREIHLHLHFSLTLGHDLIKNYRLPIEDAIIAKSVNKHGIKLPPPEIELVILVIRLVLKHRFLSLLISHPRNWFFFAMGKNPMRLKPAARREFTYLMSVSNTEEIRSIVEKIFPFLPYEVYCYCKESIEADSNHFKAGRRLCQALKRNQRVSSPWVAMLAVYRYIALSINNLCIKLFSRKPPKKGILPYGAIVAFVGGDGAGKTTNVELVEKWFGRFLRTTSIHIGRPKRGPLGKIASGLLRLEKLARKIKSRFGFKQTSPLVFEVIGLWLLAKYRYLAFQKAHTLRSKGTLVCLDRIPVPSAKYMDRPRIRELTRDAWWSRFLANQEDWFHHNIRGIDAVIVLKLDPLVAIERRPMDNRDQLMKRSGEIFDREWDLDSVSVIDASQPLDLVNKKAKEIIWQAMTTKVVVLELTGPAACGKSTTAKRVREGTYNIETTLRIRPHGLMVAKVLLRRLIDISVIGIKSKSLQAIKSIICLDVLLSLIEKHKTTHCLHCRVLILDNGPFLMLAVLSHYYSLDPSIGSGWLKSLHSRALGTIDCVFMLDAPDDVLRSRLNGRDQSHRMKTRGGRHLSAFAVEYRELYTELLSEFGTSNVVRIDTNDNSLAQIRSQIMSDISVRKLEPAK